MIHENFIWLGVVVNFLGGTGYAWATVRGRTQPNRMTWALWSGSAWIAFAAQISQGVGAAAALTFTVAAIPMMVFIASFVNRNSYWKLGQLDIACGVVSIAALVLWKVTASGNVAIALSICCDAFAGVPTIVKAFKHPESEGSIAYTTGAFNAAVTLLVLERFDFATAAFPIYFLVLCATISALILLVPRLRNRDDTAAVHTAATRDESDRDLRTFLNALLDSRQMSIAVVAGIFDVFFADVLIRRDHAERTGFDVVARTKGDVVAIAVVAPGQLADVDVARMITSIRHTSHCRLVVLLQADQYQLSTFRLRRYALRHNVDLLLCENVELLVDAVLAWQDVGSNLYDRIDNAVAARIHELEHSSRPKAHAEAGRMLQPRDNPSTPVATATYHDLN